MGWNPDNSNPDEMKVSEWNSAAYKMKRLHEIMSEINQLDDNLIAWNPEKQTYNFKVKFARCENLYQEVESKLTPTESEKVEALRKAIKKFMELHPIIIKKKMKVYPYDIKTTVDEGVFRVIEEKLSEYETVCRKLIDDHGMDTPYGEEDALF